VEPLEKRMAALTPPPAPEDFVKQREQPLKRETPPKSSSTTKPADTGPKLKEPSDNQRKRHFAKPQPDLRPRPEDIAKGFSSPGGAQDFFPEGELDEAVVDINTREERFFSYLLHLKQKIQGVWVYPNVAAKAGIGGSLSIEFSISKDGELLYVNLLDSSGHTILDESAVKAIKTAAPYFPFPPRLKAKRLKIRANFLYITGSSFRSQM
jgi:protein TonB